MKHKPRKRFGQHFLHDVGVIHRILTAVDPQPSDHVVEIGPGRGALTRGLLKLTDTLDAVELDRDLIEPLREACREWGDLRVHNADALTFDFCRLHPGEKALRLVGNLPYNISTPLLFHLLDQAHCLRDMHFMVQKEVAKRLAAQPGGHCYGRLSVMVQYHCQATRLFDIGPRAFWPPPKVDSAVVRLVPHSQPPVTVKNPVVFGQVVGRAFSQRRKTLRNALKELLSAAEIQAINIDPGLRAEVLDLAAFARLANAVSGKA